MAVGDPRFVVRFYFTHQLAEACQRFVGSVLVLHPGAFMSAIRSLLDDAPRPASQAEAILWWTNLQGAATRGAACHHEWFHRTLDPTPCSLPATTVLACEGFAPATAAQALLGWATSFDQTFGNEHAWPPAVKAALLMQMHPTRSWYVTELARAVKVSAPTLERGFSRIYGIPVQRYHSLVRARQAAIAIRKNLACIESLVLEHGYRSAKDLYRPIRRLTGLTLADLRRIDERTFQSLLQGSLAMPLPGLGPAVELVSG